MRQILVAGYAQDEGPRHHPTPGGRRLVATRGSHRQFKHPVRPGRVTTTGRQRDEIASSTPREYAQTGRTRGKGLMHRYLIVIEPAGHNYSAYSPDLPGCVATGATREATRALMQQAITLHLQGLVEDEQPIPEPAASAELVEVSV